MSEYRDHSRLRIALWSGLIVLFAAALAARSHFAGRLPWQDAATGGILTAIFAAALFFAGCTLLAKLCSAPRPLYAVARHIIVEGLRRRTALALALANFALIAMLLGSMDPSGTAEYRVKNFLTYGMAATLVTASAFVILQSSASLSSDFEERQVYSIFTKPVARAHYLAGKWLGLVAVCALQLACAGVALALGVEILLANPALDAGEARAVRDALVVVHSTLTPVPAISLDEKINRDLPEALRRFPDRFAGLSADEQREKMRSLLLVEWRNLPPGEGRSYLFHRLASGGAARADILVRFKPQKFGVELGQKVELALELNGRAQRYFAAINEVNVLRVDPAWLDRGGDLLVQIRNPIPDADSGTLHTAISLHGRDGIEVLEPSGRLGGNLARLLCVYLVQLGFLAAIGVFGGSFMSFPVTCLLLIVIAGAANSSHYLLSVTTDPVHTHAHGPEDAHEHGEETPGVGESIVDALESFGLGVARVLERYSALSPAELLVEGRALSWRALGEYAFYIGGVWTGLVSAAAITLFRRRELARVQA